MSIHHVKVALSSSLWLFPSHPSKLFALNARTLALLSIAAKPPNDNYGDDDYYKLLGTVLICTLMGACMPSMASADLKDMWTNVACVALLVITVIVNICLQLQRYIISPVTYHEHAMVIIFMGMLLSVLLTQALALEAMVSDLRAMVSDQLEAIRTEARPGYRIGVVQGKTWTWNAIEQESRIKLMMVLTSNPQNVLARSPSAAVVGALVLSSVIMLLQTRLKISLVYNDTQSSGFISGFPFIRNHPLGKFQGPTIFICGFICLWRWLQVAWHEDRPFLSFLLDAEPSYWCRKLSNVRHKLRAGPQRQPNVLEEGQYAFKEVLYYAADFLLFLTIIPIQRVLVALIRFLHILSALLMQVLIWPIKLASAHICCRLCCLSRRVSPMAATSRHGVICMAGEDASIVHRQFIKATTFIIQKQIKRVHTKADTTDLIAFLRASSREDSSLKNGGICHALDQGGAPDVNNLHVEHGYQYGWSLTLVSLLAVLNKIEMEMLERSETFEAAMGAYWQAQKMVTVVDEQYRPIVCSKETYLAASALVWSELPKKKPRRSQKENGKAVLDPEDILKDLLLACESHIRQFNERKRNCNVAASWPVETVMFYTMQTLCKNLLKWWMNKQLENHASNSDIDGGDRAANAKMLVKYMSFLLADILAGCLSNLPMVLNACMTDAVHEGQTEIVENGIFLVAQGKKLWAELQWPTPSCAPVNTFGQLWQWF